MSHDCCLTPNFPDRRKRDENPGWDYIFNSVTVLHTIMVIGILTWGIKLLLGVSEPPTAITLTMPHDIYLGWIGLHFAVPAVIWFGQVIRRKASEQRVRTGWQLQLVGDLGAFGLLITYALALSSSGHHLPRGDADYQEQMQLGLAVCALFFVIRDALKAWKPAADAK